MFLRFINVSKSAGQTVDHAHVHLIPRFNGDVDNPKGGVRWVIPEKAPYWGEEVTLVEALKKKTTSTIEATITHGRLIRGRNAEVFFLGAREVREARARGLDLRRAQNTQVIVGHDGSVICDSAPL